MAPLWKPNSARHESANWLKEPKVNGPWEVSWRSVFIGASSTQMIGTKKKAVKASSTISATRRQMTRELITSVGSEQSAAPHEQTG